MAASARTSGSSLRDDWIEGNWSGGPNEVTPPFTYVCRVSGLSSSNWSTLEGREGPPHVLGVADSSDLIFPVNDCNAQVNSNGQPIGCSPTQAPDKYAIIGFIVLHLEGVLDSAAEWGGSSLRCLRRSTSTCHHRPRRIRSRASVPRASARTSTPSGVEDFMLNGQTSSAELDVRRHEQVLHMDRSRDSAGWTSTSTGGSTANAASRRTTRAPCA